MAVMGLGKGVALYSWCVGSSGILGFFITLILFLCGCEMWSVCIAYISARVIGTVCRLWLGWYLVQLSPTYWLKRVLLPIVITACIVSSCGLLARMTFDESILRVMLTTLSCEVVFFPLAWICVLDREERKQVITWIHQLRDKILVHR